MILIGCDKCGCTGVAHHNAKFYFEQLTEAYKYIEELEKAVEDLKQFKK